MRDKPLISIIVPVYKVEKYLHECIESILCQTYQYFELILVDDGSPDSCGEICEEYARGDSRIRVIHKKNGGLSDARNKGIEVAKGMYITFIDSDDYVWDKYLEVLLSIALNYDADIVQGELTRKQETLGKDSTTELTIFENEEIIRSFLLFEKMHVSVCKKLYRRELFEDIKFPVGRINEDTLTTYKLLLKARKAIYISNIIYYYRINPEGIMHSFFSPKRFEVLSVIDEMKCYAGLDVDKLSQEIEYYQMRIAIWLYHECVLSRTIKKYKEKSIEIEQILKEVSLKNPYLNLKYKMLLVLLKLSPTVYRWIIFVLKKEDRS